MKRILLVEDDAFIRDLVSAKLAQESFDVVVTDSGEGALEHLDSNHTDLMILDLELVGMQGISVISEIANKPLDKHLPIIIFSNNDEPEVKEECKKLGVKDFFVKVNTDLDDLIKRVNEMVS